MADVQFKTASGPSISTVAKVKGDLACLLIVRNMWYHLLLKRRLLLTAAPFCVVLFQLRLKISRIPSDFWRC